MEFKTWIEVSFERMETLKALELPDVFTTDKGAGRIQAVDQSVICSATMQKWNKEHPTLAIIPTSRPLVSFHPNVHVVPYSDHSSYQELEDFVSALKPTSLVPIVGNCVPESLSALLPGKRRHEVLVPESVQHYMLRQAESQLSSSGYTSSHRRHFRPPAPKGVIFESPVRGSRKSYSETWGPECLEQEASEEEMDTEGSEKDSECILIDMSKKCSPDRNRRGGGDTWHLNIVQTVSEDMVMAESQRTKNNFAPGEILTNTKAYWKPTSSTRSSLETSAEITNKMASNENNNSQHSWSEIFENSHTLSDGDSMSEHSDHGVEQEDTIISSVNINQQVEHENDRSDSVSLLQNNPDNNLFSSSSSPSLLEEAYVKELESSILESLPFTEEDLQTWGLLPQSFIQMFPLCPVHVRQADKSSDE